MWKVLTSMNVRRVSVTITNIIRECDRDFFGQSTYDNFLLYTDIQRDYLQRLCQEIPIFLKNKVKSGTTEQENQILDTKFLLDCIFNRPDISPKRILFEAAKKAAEYCPIFEATYKNIKIKLNFLCLHLI